MPHQGTQVTVWILMCLALALIPLAIAINIAIGQIVQTIRLPLYLDSIGTVLVLSLIHI